jgi:hypothetical protein
LTHRKQSQAFFSEEKKQKTFVPFAADACRLWLKCPKRRCRRKEQKLFGPFFQKKDYLPAMWHFQGGLV